ncbi:helix-turn-helix domain-containing protein [Acidianus manzaensis]|uniref:Uncharacterized protein n=1 Tax=Acidianus manzaensis TaxID=282676 RepID=A0A1W6JYK0_9CREN|nr:helix-turn-helix domain-containing protein [Acidianus manzaensis]ARM75338.1 hypothetical protein B6F84_04350 [Acidianus manzaensis]
MEERFLSKEFITKSGRRMKINRLVSALYGLSEFDLNVYSIIREKREITLKELIEITNKNKPILIKSLKNLENLDLITKQKIRNGEKGRPVYIYKINSILENILLTDLKELVNFIH